MKKILFPTDFSAQSLNAFKYVLQFAKQMNSTIYALHTYKVPVVPTNAPVGVYETIAKNTAQGELYDFEDYSKKLRVLAKTAGIPNVPIQHLITEGFTVDQVVETAIEESVDLIIMGTEGAKSLFSYFFGSKTSTVTRNAHCPVLSIPYNTDLPIMPIREIVYATDFETPQDETALDVVELSQFLNAKVTFLHVTDSRERWGKDKLERFKEAEWLANVVNRISFEVIENPDVLAGIKSFVAANHIDLVCMQAHKKNFLSRLFKGSYTSDMSLITNVPLLVYHEKQDA